MQLKRCIIISEDVQETNTERNDADLKFKAMSPLLDSSGDANLIRVLDYIDELRTECEVKLSYMELVIERMKEQIDSIKEANV